ncbi:MAG: DMT family transporter [Chloroflexi bacterium]|nr:DMT family transporter [Chloroflexota bacterium]
MTSTGAPWRVYVALVLASALWASLYTAAKPAVGVLGAAPVMLCRVTLACVCLSPLVLARGGLRPVRDQLRAHWRGIVLLGLLNFGLSQLLALSALNYLPASVNGVLNNTHPLWVALGTAAFFPRRQPRLLIGGSVVALVGVVFVFLPDLTSGVSGVSALGVVLSLAGSGVIAIGTVIGRRVMHGSDAMTVSALASGVAIVPVLLLTLASGGLAPIVEAPTSIKLLLVYVGVGCTAINFALWYYGLKHLPAAAASAFQYLIPPIGVALAAIFLQEPVTVALLAGTACILVGLAATQVASTNVSVTIRQRGQREAPLA